MLGLPLKYWLKHPGTAIKDIAGDPMGICSRVHDFRDAEKEQQRPRCNYDQNEYWEEWLHQQIGAAWPCESADEFWALWNEIIEELKFNGIRPGPLSYHGWNDGDAGFVRAVWCLVRSLKPQNVIETGVAHGVTSRFVLEALERNGSGKLWSIDLPPLDRTWQSQIGMAVPDRFGSRWTYLEGSSRRKLPELLSKIGKVDLFIHDSLHSERNVRFELDCVWDSIHAGGASVVDDIDSNWGFHSFCAAAPGLKFAVCEAEPLHPDLRRFNHKGLFGILLKDGLKSTP